jgi:hypothetical protein
MSDKIKFKFNKDNFVDFINKLKDLTNIDDTIKLKIDNDHILMYSMLGGSIMLAFKNYLVNTKDYLEMGEEIENSLDIVVANSSKFVKNLDFIKNSKDSDTITMNVVFKPSQEDENIMSARSLQIVGGKLKVNWIAGERYEVRDINKDALRQRLDIKNRKWSFILTNSQFSDVKKLSNINSEKIVSINVNNGKVIMSETAAWELEIGEIETKSGSFIFNKRFFKCINDDRDDIEFSLFDSFILIKDKNSNLMLSYEQDFSDDDL